MKGLTLHTISRAVVGSIVFACVLALPACSGDGSDETPDAELFVGNWSLVAVSDAEGDKLAVFNASFDGFEVDFAGTGTATITVDPADAESPTVMAVGTYVVDEPAMVLRLTIDAGGVPLTIPFAYEFESDTRVKVTTNSIPLNVAFGTTLVGNATITLGKA